MENKMKLEYVKGSKVLGMATGYYLGNEYLSKHKNEAITILRMRIEKAGDEVGDRSRTAWEKGKELCPEEWEAVNIEFQKVRERVAKINEKKKPYYAKMNERVTERRITNLNERINYLEEKKKRIILDIDDKINLIKEEIKEAGQQRKIDDILRSENNEQ